MEDLWPERISMGDYQLVCLVADGLILAGYMDIGVYDNISWSVLSLEMDLHNELQTDFSHAIDRVSAFTT